MVSIRVAPGWLRLLAVVLPLTLGVGAVTAGLVHAGSLPSQAAASTQIDPQPPGWPPPASPTPAGVGAGLASQVAGAGLLVDVSGAVVHPGLYRVDRGERLYAALAAAGGATPEADPQRMPNLAARLRDGQQVKVPFRRGPSALGRSASAVDLNHASLDELAQVPGFSPDLAQAVIDYRTGFGGFTTVRELVTELGMSEADFQQARRLVRV